MYLIKAGQRIIYDSTDKDTYPVLSPSFEEELNGAGTLTFTVIPGHPYYDDIKHMQTFVTAYRDDEEIFYGRVLSTDKKIDGQMEVTCEGGLTFFLDSEMSKATYNETCEAFLTRILDNHNSMVEVPKRFSLGVINVPKAIELDEQTGKTKKWEFKIGGFASTKSVLESLVLGQFGGFFRVRPDGNGGHILDYIKDYGRTSTQLVSIGHNIVDKDDRVSGEGMFTILRPIYGKNNTIANLTQQDVTLPNVTKQGEFLILDDLVQEYGKIYHTEAFDKIDKAKECLKKAEEFIVKQGSQLPASTEIGFVDFYHLNRQGFEERCQEVANTDYAHLVSGITFQLGNVDLLKRPVIPLQRVVDAGWDDEEADPDSIATLYSVTYSGGTIEGLNYVLQDNIVFLATPILSYGLVLSPEELEGYFEGLVNAGANTITSLLNADKIVNGGKGLIIGVANIVGTPEHSYDLAADWAIAVHDIQAYLYDDYVSDIRLGDIFTNIEGFEGETLTVGSISLDFENPGNDTMTLKNQEELNSSGVTSNSLTIIESKYAAKETFRYHYINEEFDEVNGKLGIYAPLIELNAKNISSLAENTQLVVQRKEGSLSEFNIYALDYTDDPLKPGEYVPTFTMNINGIKLSDGYLKNEDGEEIAGKASLAVQADRITAEVTRASSSEGAITSRVEQQAGQITQVIADVTILGQITNQITGSALWQNKDDITAAAGKLEVDDQGNLHVIDGSGLFVGTGQASLAVYDSGNLTAGVIVNKVNGGSVSINASKINLNGETVADAISAVNAEFDNLVSGSTVASMLSATAVVASRLSVGGSFEFSGSTIGLSSINWGMASGLTAKSFLGPESMSLGHYHNLNVDSSTGQVTIGAPTLSTSGSTFNIADTTFYQRAVSAAEQAGEATGYTAGYADGYPASVEVLGVSSPTKSGSIWTSTATAYVTTADGQATPSFPVTGMVVTGVYNAGANSVDLSESWNGATYTVSTTGQTTAHSESITLSATSGIIYNPSTHTYLAGATAEAGGATRAYDATPAESGTEAYDAGRAAIGITGSWNGATYTATTVGKVTESTTDTTLNSHEVTPIDNPVTVYDYNPATVRIATTTSYNVYNRNSSLTYTEQGSPYSGTLLTPNGSGGYTRITETLYHAGTSKTVTQAYGTQQYLYVTQNNTDTYYKKSTTKHTYYTAGTKTTYYTIPGS